MKKHFSDLKTSFLIISEKFSSLPDASRALKKYNVVNWELIKNKPAALDDIDKVVSQTLYVLSQRYKDIYQNTSVFEAFQDVLYFQIETLIKTMDFYSTNEIAALQKNLLNNNFLEGTALFAGAFQKNIIEVPNLALLKVSADLKGVIASSLPKGIPSVVSGMYVNTAQKMAGVDDISYNKEKKLFFTEANPDSSATVDETNIICSGLGILPDITETEMFDFLNYMSRFLPLAATHATGEKILECIRTWKAYIDFTQDRYFHGRSFSKGSCPYTQDQMCSAPKGITWHGRFNFPGESHYYFSDARKGAEIEVKKHCRQEDKIQIAILKPVRKIRMIDLSEEHSNSKFLEYCRFPMDSHSDIKMKREYLIPSYVASCCKSCKIEGIKYYGSRDYANYVCWDDGYFETLSYDFI